MLHHFEPAGREPAGIPDRRWRRLRVGLLVGAGVIFVALATVGTYGLITGTGSPHPSSIPAAATHRAPVEPGGRSIPPIQAPPLPNTSDPRIFARAAADALFTWDTTTGTSADEYERPLVAAGDPSGTDAPGLIHDLSNYFPPPNAWAQLRRYRTRQTLAVTRLFIPKQWPQAVAEADGWIRSGVVGYTVSGTRHRTGIWLGRPVSSSHAVSFTMFLSCPPATQRCVLLRLSRLNHPLR
jgi:hypothetical protein